MPRIRPAAGRSDSASYLNGTASKIPLNDDRQEKAQRTHSRQLLHEAQMNSLRAAATPSKARRSLLSPNQHDGPSTPSRDEMDSSQLVVTGSAVTPMKRAPPVLARYEEWMKLVTDNKLTANNSWDIGLIDYFKDMSLLKEGDGINFQKASCTLDGCVKIYINRVDNVVTETDKLRNGLADSSNKSKKNAEHDAGDDEDGDDEDGGRKRSKKKARSHEATLAKDFAQLQLKKMELEFAVDPLFKKASADFDEGGAKGLLLNNLCIDSSGRIVFDSSDDTQGDTEETRRDSMQLEIKDSGSEVENAPVDVASLGARFFPDLSVLDHQDICPSLKMFELGNGDGTLDLPFLRAEDWKKDLNQSLDDPDDDARSGIVIGDDNADDFDGVMDGFDLPPDTGFGQGGDVWAEALNIQPENQQFGSDPADQGEGPDDLREGGELDANSRQYGITLVRDQDAHDNILAYFDNALKKNWAGPEHWKIQKVKAAAKPNATPAKRKEKEPFEIDFNAPMSQQLADVLFTQAPTTQSINLPKAQWKSRNKNLLPADKHFNSKSLLRLFLKPKAILGPRRRQIQRSRSHNAEPEPREMDEAYWAHRHAEDQADAAEAGPGAGAYDANFFQDDGMPFADGHAGDDGDDVFDDARETPEPGPGAGIGGVPSSQASQGAFGTDLIAASQRARPQFIQYARVAKKVDVRKLKDNMWRGIGFVSPHDSSEAEKQPAPQPSPTPEDATLKFRDIVNNLSTVYPSQQMADISTSYCFIALLHLANEKGLTIMNEEGFTDLSIKRDHTAEITGEIDA